ncbi:MAG: RNA polymerase sigma factor SigM [Acidobacteria bacterium]|nr:MAG: RNA polymerase sigma factor SigM [Acidobacteriota bacterium]REJ98307.1 MAG: RNA polymerase sigma factor SigM [Acidobacteriota bacterium]REK17051.1 MAG: RNA polymerase sigma factor SigM [Acidobacteriota bacterium]REK42961.1 MAG: RNA polymerase sigma factor SigM [Acidobacteriota bacterium]
MLKAESMHENTSESDLIAAGREGDRSAFEELFRRNQRRVYSVAFNFFGGDRQLAEDISQQVFLKLYVGIAKFRGDAQVSTWLYRVTVNQCIDEQKKRNRFSFFGDIFEREDSEVVEIDDSTEERLEISESVKKAVAELKPIFRAPLVLKHVEGLSYSEMAQVLDISEGTVASRLSRGHKMLAESLRHLQVSGNQ